MDVLSDNVAAPHEYLKLEYDDRYYVQTAKNSIESLGHIVAEAGSNEDEAISRRAAHDRKGDEGWIDFHYEPDTETFSVTGDGDGMTGDVMKDRLRRVGAEAQPDARRGFFHRGIREVFIAMGGGRVTSIGALSDGTEVLSQAIFDPHKGMAMTIKDAEPTPEQRAELGLIGTGTQVEIPMKRFARERPGQFTFPKMEQQIRDCVGIRPVLSDPGRIVRFTYGNEPPRLLRFEYPFGQDLVVDREITILGQKAIFWAKVADKPLKGGLRGGKQMRRSGILIRGERAAYEVSAGEKIATQPAVPRIFGELRMDSIEQVQREADQDADEESQLVYKPDRSGLNGEHPISTAIYKFIDETLGPLIADLDSGEEQRQVSGDMRRQLAKLARVINQVIRAEIQSVTDPTSDKTQKSVEKDKPEREPPERSADAEREVDNGIGFARGRIFIDAAQSRTVEVWFDSKLIVKGTSVTLNSPKTPEVPAAELAANTVPAPGKDGIAAIDLTLHAGNTEGRHELAVSASGYEATLVVHVRYPRAAGFISNIVPVDQDWELGSALYDPSSGVVKVFVGRPEFKNAAARAKRDGDKDPWKNKVYRTLVVESVREAALWEAAKLQASVDWDEMSHEERQGETARLDLVRTTYQELDYRLRAKLLHVFGEV
jgi:hypothetical protein